MGPHPNVILASSKQAMLLWFSVTLIITGICPLFVFGDCDLSEIPNGRASLRMRGRAIQFVCDDDFILFGESYINCVNNIWADPPPRCVAPGCDVIDNITNGEVKSSQNGSVVEITCQPGTVRQGEATLTCDGKTWSAEVPECLEPYQVRSCDFESSAFCGWIQDTTDDFDWTRHSGETTTGRTGPNSDHTLGPHDPTGHYIYMEASTPRYPGDVARLMSPWFPSDVSARCFQFWYHMNGPNEMNAVGTLRISLRTGSLESTMFSMSGNQGENWNVGYFRIPTCEDPFQILLEAERKNSYASDIAVDDWQIVQCISTTPNIRDPAAQLEKHTTQGEGISTSSSPNSSLTLVGVSTTTEIIPSQSSMTADRHPLSRKPATSTTAATRPNVTGTYVNDSTSTSKSNAEVSPSSNTEKESNSLITVMSIHPPNASVSPNSLDGNLSISRASKNIYSESVTSSKKQNDPSTTPSQPKTTYFRGEPGLKTKNMASSTTFSTTVHFIHSHNSHKTHGMVFTTNAIVNLAIGLVVVCLFTGILIIMGCVCWRQHKMYNDKYQELKLFVETHYRAKYVNTSISPKCCDDCSEIKVTD